MERDPKKHGKGVGRVRREGRLANIGVCFPGHCWKPGPLSAGQLPARNICVMDRKSCYLSISSHSPLIEGCPGYVNFPSCALCSDWAGLEKVLGQKSWKTEAKSFGCNNVSINLTPILTVQPSCDYNQAGLRSCATGHQRCLPQKARSQ